MKLKVFAFVVLLAIIAPILAGCTTSAPAVVMTTTKTVTATASTVTVTAPTVTVTSLPASFIPVTFTGSGDKTTPPFTVTTSEWIIDWSYTTNSNYPAFYIYIYPRGETASYVTSIDAGEATSGTSYCYAGAGEYYVEVLAANLISWTITIRPTG